jgi:threonine/homoserine/homoserine lactone efflux protein
MTVGWLGGYCWVVDRVGDVLRRGRIRRLIDGISGTALVTLGIRVALE